MANKTAPRTTLQRLLNPTSTDLYRPAMWSAVVPHKSGQQHLVAHGVIFSELIKHSL